MSTDEAPKHKYSTTSPTGLSRDEVGYPVGEGLNEPHEYWQNCNRWIEDGDNPRPSHHVIGGVEHDPKGRWDERMPWWSLSPCEAFDKSEEITELKMSTFRCRGREPPHRIFVVGESNGEETYAAVMIIMEDCWVTTYRLGDSIYPSWVKAYVWELLRAKGHFD